MNQKNQYEYCMDIETLKKSIDFTNAEKKLISSLGIQADAILPLFLSLRDGGDWSYSTENIKTISVLDKTTVYNEENKTGYSLEEIYLFINPVLKTEEGIVHRLEKCGDREERMLVRRPYRISVVSERIIKATLHPLKKEIKVQELKEKELVFEGSTAYDIAHEIEHLAHEEIKGESLWEFRFTDIKIRG
jgi:predicted metalloprotease